MFQVREMSAEDAEQVQALYADSWRRTYEHIYDSAELDRQIEKRFTPELQSDEAENGDIITLVATKDGVIVGASLAKMDDRNQAWLDRLHILPEHFGSGLAEDLLRATLTKHSGLQSIALKVLKGNERAIAFYGKHGFSITGEVEDDPSVGEVDAVIMTRTLPRG
jgi:ribosomal protein S18 acetylase RimI-like enzyme